MGTDAINGSGGTNYLGLLEQINAKNEKTEETSSKEAKQKTGWEHAADVVNVGTQCNVMAAIVPGFGSLGKVVEGLAAKGSGGQIAKEYLIDAGMDGGAAGLAFFAGLMTHHNPVYDGISATVHCAAAVAEAADTESPKDFQKADGEGSQKAIGSAKNSSSDAVAFAKNAKAAIDAAPTSSIDTKTKSGGTSLGALSGEIKGGGQGASGEIE
jgi:hypothetical protein